VAAAARGTPKRGASFSLLDAEAEENLKPSANDLVLKKFDDIYETQRRVLFFHAPQLSQ
jgi:hypothetical protein